MKKILIAAMAANRVIGSKGKVPWYSKEDLVHFKSVTMSYPILMGRKTFDSIGNELEGRVNIVLSKNNDSANCSGNYLMFSNIAAAYNFCTEQNYDKLFIIGGGEIFKQTIDDADEIILTRFNFDAEGDTYFPAIDEKEWKIIRLENKNEFDILHFKK